MPMAQGSRPQAAVVWKRPWPRGEGHRHPACGTFMAPESKITDTLGENFRIILCEKWPLFARYLSGIRELHLREERQM